MLGYSASITLLHLLGIGLCLHYAAGYPALLGLGFTAYLFGVRHAFDADHIAAVDDTVRYLLQRGRRPLGVGFYFSLGHSTVVLMLAVLATCFGTLLKDRLPGLMHFGDIAGSLISGLFLWLVGILNLLILLDMLQHWKDGRSGHHHHGQLEELLARRGLMNRLFGRHLTPMVQHSWQMYPIGLLFGLGFDTASEIALLALTGGAAAGNLPAAGVLALPVLFMAGMSLMDTADGVLMTRAYGWAFLTPVRRIFYNLTTTTLSVLLALVVGTIELAQALITRLGLHSQVADWISAISFERLGLLTIVIFLAAWVLSFGLWKLGDFERTHARVDSGDQPS